MLMGMQICTHSGGSENLCLTPGSTKLYSILTSPHDLSLYLHCNFIFRNSFSLEFFYGFIFEYYIGQHGTVVI